MSIHWDSKTEIRFQERLTQKAKVSYRMVLGLAVVLFPCFYDYYRTDCTSYESDLCSIITLYEKIEK